MIISKPGISSSEIQTFDNPFIKLPIENFLDILEITPVPPQVALINAINDPQYRFVVATLARRTGKTFMSNLIAFLVCMIPGCNILIMAPNYSLSSISWDLQKKFIQQFDLKLERNNAKDKILEWSNGSTVRVGSVSQVDSVIGRSYDFILFDEAAINDKGGEAFMTQLMPTLDKPNAKAVFISTPRHRNWFYDYYMRGFDDTGNFSEWVSILATYKDNPRVDPKVIATARASMSKAEFEQEYECSFVALQGQVWNLPSNNVVEIDVDKIVVEDIVAGLDVGFTDPTALIVIYTDGYYFYCVKEYIDNGRTTAEHAEVIKEMTEDVDFIYIDSAAAQTAHDLAETYDIGTVYADKSKLDGLGYVASIVENGRLFVDASCTELIWSMENYVWDTREGLRKEDTLNTGTSKRASHMCDALRYALYSHAYSMEGLIDIDAVPPAPDFPVYDKNEVLARPRSWI